MTQKQIFYFNSYDVLKLSNKQWNNDIRKHYIMYNQLKNAETITEQDIDNLLENNYNFWVKVITENPVFNKGHVLVELTLLYSNKPILGYIAKQCYINKLKIHDLVL
ncbi:hypothetical protein P5609_012600 [Bacillus licheniformis]|uniref:hypothetical protein n=1 Tax=Bacillus licheniformis TaxID=1402 RepID=UPI00115D92DA|nr:hypothetical protein [Bacillus licheniformis]MBW7632562.1 hypothetical protein [Bacillus licheniformis]MDH3163830.1 hypothetical protein [Bacillus licheniformis]MED4409622.1 hypothetical protein [Bacillus licheniformis]QDL80053.1 hypothetical protein D9Y32_22850 [Bacillus licheniformis]